MGWDGGVLIAWANWIHCDESGMLISVDDLVVIWVSVAEMQEFNSVIEKKEKRKKKN